MPRPAPARAVSALRRVGWGQCRVLRRRGPSPRGAASGGGTAACLRRRGPSPRGAASGGGTAASCFGAVRLPRGAASGGGNASSCVGAVRLRWAPRGAASGGGTAESCVGAVRLRWPPRRVAALPSPASARSVFAGRRVGWRQCRVLRRRGPFPRGAASCFGAVRLRERRVGCGNAASCFGAVRLRERRVGWRQCRVLRRRRPFPRGAASGGGTAESCVGNAAVCVGACRLRGAPRPVAALPRPASAMPRPASARSVSPGRRVRWRQCLVLLAAHLPHPKTKITAYNLLTSALAFLIRSWGRGLG